MVEFVVRNHDSAVDPCRLMSIAPAEVHPVDVPTTRHEWRLAVQILVGGQLDGLGIGISRGYKE